MIVIYRPIMQESSELRDSIVDCVHTSLSELQSIWDEIGIRGEMLKLNTAVC